MLAYVAGCAFVVVARLQSAQCALSDHEIDKLPGWSDDLPSKCASRQKLYRDLEMEDVVTASMRQCVQFMLALEIVLVWVQTSSELLFG